MRMKAADELDEATRRYGHTEREHADARDRVVSAVVTALREGMSPTEVAARSPFTPAYVRRIAREHDIEPARPGPKKKAGGFPSG